jgi:hypothetical protein
MTILTWAKTALYVSLAALFGFLSYLSWTVAGQVRTLGQQTSVVLTQAGTSFQSLNTTLILVNQPCGGGHPCGLLSELNKSVTKVGDAIVTTQLQERATAPHVIAAMDTFNTASQKLGRSADSLSGTAEATTAMMGESQRTIAATQPLLSAFASSGEDLDSLLKRKSVTDTLDNLDKMSASGSAILDDGRKVTDRVTADYLSPKPWWKKVYRFAGDTYDYGALFARHVP